jgi:hypothetical protein
MSNWQLCGIDPAPFDALFQLSDSQLREQGAVRRIADADAGFPCRISLEDARAGDELLLLPFEHHAADSPYRAAGPVFVRRGAVRRRLAPGEVPPYVTRRLISVRAYDAAAMMVDASVCEGADVAAELDRLFGEAAVQYVHLHNARRGCFSCAVERIA